MKRMRKLQFLTNETEKMKANQTNTIENIYIYF